MIVFEIDPNIFTFNERGLNENLQRIIGLGGSLSAFVFGLKD